MHFASYLLQNKLVTHEQLARAITLQFSRCKSIVEIILSNEACTLDQLINSLEHFEANNLTLLESMQTLSYLDLNTKNKLIQQQKESINPLWIALVQENICNYHTARIWYEDYLKNQEVNKKPDLEFTKNKSPIPQIEVKILDPIMISELLEVFDEQKRSDLEQLLINFSKFENVEPVRSLYRELHTIKGTSRFIKASALEYIIHQLESTVQEVTRFFSFMDNELKIKTEEVLLKGLDLAWELRTDIQTHDHEKSWLNQNWQETLFNLIDTILTTNARIQELGLKVSKESIDDMF